MVYNHLPLSSLDSFWNVSTSCNLSSFTGQNDKIRHFYQMATRFANIFSSNYYRNGYELTLHFWYFTIFVHTHRRCMYLKAINYDGFRSDHAPFTWKISDYCTRFFFKEILCRSPNLLLLYITRLYVYMLKINLYVATEHSAETRLQVK